MLELQYDTKSITNNQYKIAYETNITTYADAAHDGTDGTDWYRSGDGGDELHEAGHCQCRLWREL